MPKKHQHPVGAGRPTEGHAEPQQVDIITLRRDDRFVWFPEADASAPLVPPITPSGSGGSKGSPR